MGVGGARALLLLPRLQHGLQLLLELLGVPGEVLHLLFVLLLLGLSPLVLLDASRGFL